MPTTREEWKIRVAEVVNEFLFERIDARTIIAIDRAIVKKVMSYPDGTWDIAFDMSNAYFTHGR